MIFGLICTGKSFSEAFILTSTNPQFDKRLFIDLPVQFMKTTSSEHVVYSRLWNRRSPMNKRSPWKIWQKE